jgi:hypothetical protein
MKRLFVFALFISVCTACDADNDPGAEIVPTAVNFISTDNQISEQSEGHEVIILLDEVAKTDGTLEMAFSSEDEYGTYFTTDPVVTGGKISIAIEKGEIEVSFSILPVNNAKLNGNKTASFSIVNATGSVKLGGAIDYSLTLIDDELLNKPKSATKIGSGLTQNISRYEYNENGLVSEIHWESKTIFGTSIGMDEYFYNEADGIIRLSRLSGAVEINYGWADGRIVKAEHVINGVIMTYTNYEYDEIGRVKKVDLFTNNGTGDFTSDFYTVYTYYEDGNVHEITSYSFDENENAFIVSATTTYEGYVEGHNPFPVEVLPNHYIQTKLPTYYSRSAQTSLLEFNVAYEFAENGNLAKKEITGAVADAGVTTYTYF